MPMLLHANKAKMRYCLGIVSLAFLASSARAQLTTVTGTVKDVNGVAYANAQIKMQLVLAGGGAVTGQPTVTVSNQAQCVSGGFGSAPCKVPFQGTVGPLALSPTGSFTINLQDNTLITPAATQWLFTANSTGAPPPLGTGPQVCTAQVTISGAAQTVTALQSCPALSAGGGGGTPGAPASSLQFNNAGAFGGAAFLYQPSPAVGAVCANVSCKAITSFAADSAYGLSSGDNTQTTFLEAVSDNASNLFGSAAELQMSGLGVSLAPTLMGAIAIMESGSPPTATGGNCFETGASSAPCSLGFVGQAGDAPVAGNPNTNVQDAVSFQAQIDMNRSTPAHLGNAAGFVMITPGACAGFALGNRPCAAAAENAVNLWGVEIQDLQGRGSNSAIGLHVEPQTNGGSGRFAILVESGGGPSSFDGTATSVNCRLGGATGTTSPAACTSATAGMIAIPASQTTYTVNTTKVTANSEIFVEQMTDNSGLPSAPTCNTGVTNPIQRASQALVFTFTLTSVAAVTCAKFWIVN